MFKTDQRQVYFRKSLSAKLTNTNAIDYTYTPLNWGKQKRNKETNKNKKEK